MSIPRVPRSIASALRLVLALTLVVGSALLFSSTDKPAFTVRDKAFYADSNLVNFVRPGLVVKITGSGHLRRRHYQGAVQGDRS